MALSATLCFPTIPVVFTRPSWQAQARGSSERPHQIPTCLPHLRVVDQFSKHGFCARYSPSHPESFSQFWKEQRVFASHRLVSSSKHLTSKPLTSTRLPEDVIIPQSNQLKCKRGISRVTALGEKSQASTHEKGTLTVSDGKSETYRTICDVNSPCVYRIVI